MGTRADFYVGRGKDAEWVGSIAFDGYPSGIVPDSEETESVLGMTRHKEEPWPEGGHIFDSSTEEEFRARLERFYLYRTDVTRPAMGWPWPWKTSHTTDYAYAFDAGRVWCSGGTGWFDPREEEPEEGGGRVDFPDMSERANVTLGQRSGMIVLGGP